MSTKTPTQTPKTQPPKETNKGNNYLKPPVGEEEVHVEKLRNTGHRQVRRVQQEGGGGSGRGRMKMMNIAQPTEHARKHRERRKAKVEA